MIPLKSKYKKKKENSNLQNKEKQNNPQHPNNKQKQNNPNRSPRQTKTYIYSLHDVNAWTVDNGNA